jgi:SPP1 gp7 family putative phage head morphogenesis protein
MTYWKTRYINDVKKSFNEGKKLESFLIKKYDFILKSLKKDVASFYAEFSSENTMTYAEAKRYLTVAELRSAKDDIELKKLRLKETNDKKFLNKLTRFADRKKVTRIEMLIAQIESYVTMLADIKDKNVSKHLNKTLSKMYKSSFKTLHSEINSDIKFSALTQNAVRTVIESPWSGSNYASNIWRDRGVLAENLRLELIKGFIQGSSYEDVAKSLNKKVKGSLNRTKALVRTETNYIIQMANARAYEDLGIDKYEYSAILDNRTSEVCQKENGKIYLVKDGIPGVNMPPLHVNCRSVILPVFEGDV